MPSTRKEAAKEVFFFGKAKRLDPTPRCGELDIDVSFDTKHRLILEECRCSLVNGQEMFRRLVGQDRPCDSSVIVAHDQAGAADDLAAHRTGKARSRLFIGARVGNGVTEIFPRPRLPAIAGKFVDVMSLERDDNQRSWLIICGVMASIVNGNGSSPSM